MERIKIAVAGVGNCASALLQGIEYYRQRHQEGDKEPVGLMHPEIGGYRAFDIQVVAAFDIDARKVGRPVQEAIFAQPNCTQVICQDMPDLGVLVQMGPVLDGVAEHMDQHPEQRSFVVAEAEPVDVERALRERGAEILLCYLPVGSQRAAEHYARAALGAGVSLINCIPVFIVSDPGWARRFEERGIPVVGDDVKSQIGATIVHRALMQLFADRGAMVNRTYQLNVGGNTDFLNMLNQGRLKSKRISKTQAVQSVLPEPLEPEEIHIGPSDYIPWLRDNKLCFLRIEGRGFGGIPIEVELRLSVEDSPNSGGTVIDAIRCCQLARERKIGGPLYSISAYTMKHPPQQFPDQLARGMVEEFIAGRRER
ncbi:MAG: inositol-3-phosphate synthase [Deltaproteobacteria bacterium]|nr:inositol-3-phosphate synthase [Deltaproteobacteria bacterium]MBI3079769.1 inositol-3-phosphate synthase [Deltaproteobacteria bacterium]